jgi:hypothetical protein
MQRRRHRPGDSSWSTGVPIVKFSTERGPDLLRDVFPDVAESKIYASLAEEQARSYKSAVKRGGRFNIHGSPE